MPNWVAAKRYRKGRYIKRPVYASLNRRGEIVLNQRAWKLIDNPWNVALMYDAMLQCIAVKFPVREDTFRIRKYGRGRRNIIVRAGRMLKQFGIEVNETLVFKDIEVVMEDNVPMLVLDMKNAEKINRRKHAENP